jgi:hypothetical protein
MLTGILVVSNKKFERSTKIFSGALVVDCLYLSMTADSSLGLSKMDGFYLIAINSLKEEIGRLAYLSINVNQQTSGTLRATTVHR